MLIDFWTYTCINCIRTLPVRESPGTRDYRDDGLTVVGVHSPEFAFEKDAGNVADAIDRYGHHLPGRPGQRLRHLERVRQPVLAGQVPDRRERRRPLRRTSARATTTRPRRRSARCSPRPAPATSAPRPGPGRRRARRPRAAHARDLPRAPRARRAGSTGRSPASKDYGAPDAALADAQPVRLRRRLGHRRRERRPPAPAPRRRSASRRAGSSWCSARPDGRAGAGPARRQADLRRRRRRRRPAGDATVDEQRLYRLVDLPAGRPTTRSSCASTPGSRATRSPSASRELG